MNFLDNPQTFDHLLYNYQFLPIVLNLLHRLENLIREPSEGNAWHADHILAVADGGGKVFGQFWYHNDIPAIFRKKSP